MVIRGPIRSNTSLSNLSGVSDDKTVRLSSGSLFSLAKEKCTSFGLRSGLKEITDGKRMKYENSSG